LVASSQFFSVIIQVPLFKYWFHCNTRLHLVRSVNYDSLVGVPEIFLQIPQCKRKLAYSCSRLI